MRQRVAFLRTLLADKPVLLLDEPFASLDAISRAEMQEWLAGGARRPSRRTVVLVTHDVEEALYLCDRVVVLTAAPGAGDRRARARRRRGRRRGSRRSPRRSSPRVRERALRGARGGRRDEALAAARCAVIVAPARRSGSWRRSWDLIADALNIKPFLIPAPSDVAEALWDDRELLAEDAWVTRAGGRCSGSRSRVGRSAFAFAIVLHLSDTLRRAFYPLLVASQTVPVIAIAPILVVWLGFGIGPKLAIIALVCFFPITVNTLDGLRSVDPDLLQMMRTLDAGRGQILRRVEIPSALPFLFSGAKIAAAISVIGAVFGEWAGADTGSAT